jgi:hypothetical protein
MKSFRILGLLICLSFLLLRIARAEGWQDCLISVGLTGIDCAAVEGLVWFANKRRHVASEHRISRAQIVALEHAIGAIDNQIGEEKSGYARTFDAVRQREAEAFDVDRVAEEAAWAAEAVYRRGVNANQRLLEGGAVAVFPPKGSSTPGELGGDHD